MRYGRVVTVVSWLLKASNLMRSNNIVTYCVPALCSYLMSTQWARNVKWWVMALMAMPTDNWKLWKHYCIKPINLDSRDRDRDVASRDRDVWKFGRDETETRRWYVSRPRRRDRDHNPDLPPRPNSPNQSSPNRGFGLYTCLSPWNGSERISLKSLSREGGRIGRHEITVIRERAESQHPHLHYAGHCFKLNRHHCIEQ